MKPVIIIPPDTMNSTHMEMLRKNGFCVVSATDPAKVRFLDPIPVSSNRNQIENAAISLSRKILNPGFWTEGHFSTTGKDIKNLLSASLMEILMKGTALDKNGTVQDQEQVIFTTARRDEIDRMAREEARAERLAAKQAKTVKTETPK